VIYIYTGTLVINKTLTGHVIQKNLSVFTSKQSLLSPTGHTYVQVNATGKTAPKHYTIFIALFKRY